MKDSDDVAGQAWLDFWQGTSPAPLLLHTSYDTTEEMPVDYFFREATTFPPLEHYALSLCRGRVLDVGAGTGGHALYGQAQGRDVTTLERSAAGVRIQRERGLRQVIQTDYRDYTEPGYDTVLLLMNGIGIAGTLTGLHDFLQQARRWLRPTGQLLFDSSDIAYLYEGDEGTSRPTDRYYGEVRYQYEYRGQRGAWFSWLYVDADTLRAVARDVGWQTQIIFQDDHDQYLARLTDVEK